MGGNALAEFGARRYSKPEYEQASQEVCSLLAKYNPVVIKSYEEKDSFGDLDIIVDSLPEEAYVDIPRLLSSVNFIRNKEVISVLYKELQVDIIPMSKEDKDTALLYYSYNDLGNLMGKIFHKLGLKYGHRGLTLPVRDGDHKLGEVMLTKDPEKIFIFGGFSYSQYKRGFKNLESIFQFVINSNFFNSSIYNYENLNSINRIRDRKRHTYHSFLKYLETGTLWNGSDIYSYKEYYDSNLYGHWFDPDKSGYLNLIFSAFPHARNEYWKLMLKLEENKAIKAKFNGKLVSEITGLQGIELGHFMSYLKESWGGFGPELLTQTEDYIKGRIFVAFKEWVPE